MKNWIECGFVSNDKEKSQKCLWLIFTFKFYHGSCRDHRIMKTNIYMFGNVEWFFFLYEFIVKLKVFLSCCYHHGAMFECIWCFKCCNSIYTRNFIVNY